MSKKSTSPFLEDMLGLLVQHFGADRVRAALAHVSNGAVEASEGQARRRFSNPGHQTNPSIASTLEQFRKKDGEKHRLLTDLYTRLKDGKVLPESQDIRQFAHLIGLKEISGKARKDMIPRLMRFLLEQPTEQLQVDVKTAENISEKQRQQGFSVLTDKLLGQR